MLIKAFTKSYAEFKLTAREMNYESGKIYAFIGPNGCGKSTYAKCIAGVCAADDGAVVSADVAKIGYMSQASFPFRMSVKKNIMLTASSEERADTLIDKLGLAGIASKNAKRLSGGQCARMALARALAGEFDILVLDEPCASMDMKSTLASEECIKEYAGSGHCIIIITHSLAQAERIADEIIFMDGGEIVERAYSSELINNANDTRTRDFLEFFGK